MPIRPGVYNNDYFSASNVSLYIGDTWIDEAVNFSFTVQQSRSPLYGYSDQYFRAVSKGHVLVSGEFSINFKESGYLWLVLDRYKRMQGKRSLNPFSAEADGDNGEHVLKQNIEQILNGEVSESRRTRIKKEIAEGASSSLHQASTASSLTGFSSSVRQQGGMSNAENIMEAFENVIWDGGSSSRTQELKGNNYSYGNRRVDDDRLNDFDMYITYGDYVGNDNVHHTSRKILGMHIVSWAQQVSPGIEIGQDSNILEHYTFIAQSII